jgi:chemotaxis protein methyltransferase CheR
VVNGLREFVKMVPLVAALTQTERWRRLRHRVVLLTDSRNQTITFTRFIRLPTQFDALGGPVIDFFRNSSGSSSPLKIAVLACSNGAEAYSVASVLLRAHPELDFRINASDINSEAIAKAQTARYSLMDVYDNKMMNQEFVEQTFDRDGDEFVVKPSIRERVSFEQLDLLDPDLKAKVGPFDIVFIQNVLFNLPRPLAANIFRAVMGLLEKQSVLFVEGMDFDLRARLTRKYNLKPLDYRIEEIHNDALSERAIGWPFAYWGLEPFCSARFSWRRRYATIFLKSD